MAIILREPRNPLADALGTLSQQILADAASRKEREFRSAEMEKERAFMGSENAAVRELQRGENEARMRYLTQVAADTRLSDQERTAAMRELGLAQTEMQGRVGMAQAGAAGAQGQAALAGVELQRDALRQRREMIQPLLDKLLAGAEQPTNGQPAGTIVPTPQIRKAFSDQGIDLPPVISAGEAESYRSQLISEAAPWATTPFRAIQAAFTGDTSTQLREGAVQRTDPEAWRAAQELRNLGQLGVQGLVGKEARSQSLGEVVQLLSLVSQMQ